MNTEQFEKLYNLLTCCVIASYLCLMIMALIGVLIFGYIYNKKQYLDDLKYENKRKEDILKKLDKGFFVDSSYFTYLQDLKERNKVLEDRINHIYFKKNK